VGLAKTATSVLKLLVAGIHKDGFSLHVSYATGFLVAHIAATKWYFNSEVYKKENSYYKYALLFAHGQNIWGQN